MLRAMFVDGSEDIGIDFVPTDSLQSKRSDKLQGVLGSCHLHLCASFTQLTNQFWNLVGSNATTNSYENMFAL